MDPPQVEMSVDDPNNNRELMRVERGLALTSIADNRIVSEMVGVSLVLARDSAPAPVDLDALVREDSSNNPGTYVLKGPGHVVNKAGEVIKTAIKPGARVRVYYANDGRFTRG